MDDGGWLASMLVWLTLFIVDFVTVHCWLVAMRGARKLHSRTTFFAVPCRDFLSPTPKKVSHLHATVQVPDY